MLINERYTSSRQTVITTNFPTPEKLIARLEECKRGNPYETKNYAGQRIVSRLCEMGVWITMSGTDRRIRKPRGNAA
jgi:DNA replication protein DnaC